MKQILLFPSILLALAVTAQPVITSQNFYQPQVPVIAFDAAADGILDGADGPERIWDFSQLQATGSSEIWGGEAVLPTDLQGFDLFYEANLAVQLPNGKVRYWKNTESALIAMGHDGSDDLLSLQDGAVLINYPFTYGSALSDDAFGNLSSSCRNYTWESSSEIAGVGYGILLLPTGTFHNVLKVRRVTFAIRKNVELDLDRENNIVEHFWFSPDWAGPLLYIRQWSNNGCPGSNEGAEVSFAAPSVATNVENTLSNSISFSVFPNPANDLALLRIDSENTAIIHITITDLLGHATPIQNRKIEVTGTQLVEMNISNLSSGVYLINVTSNAGSVTEKLIVN
jgi:hypothetical protein